ncbi:MAG: Ig-like domain-containing protein [Sneathiella sp.]
MLNLVPGSPLSTNLSAISRPIYVESGGGSLTVADKAFEYGVDTPDQQAGYVVVPDSGTITSIAINSASLGTAADFETSGATIRTASGNSFNSDTTLLCTATFSGGGTDDFVSTITAVADAISVENDAELLTAAASVSLAFDDQILLRERAFDAGETNGVNIINRTGNISGVFNGSNHVVIRPSAGELPVITQLIIDSPTYPVEFHIKDIEFYQPFLDTAGTGTGNQAALYLYGDDSTEVDWNIKITGCEFHSTGGLDGIVEQTSTDIHAGIHVRNGPMGIKITDNNFHDVGMAIKIYSGFNIDRNTFSEIRRDAVQSGSSTRNSSFNDNKLFNIYAMDASDHPDIWQIIKGSGDVTDIECCRNIFYGYPDTPSDGRRKTQGIFFSNGTGSPKRCRIEGNRIHTVGINSVFFTYLENSFVRGNTVLADVEHVPTGGDDNNRIHLSLGGSNNFVQYNLCNQIADFSTGSTVDNNTIIAANAITLTDHLDNPVTGDDITDPITDYDIKSGSTSDLASPKRGGHKDHVDYTNHTSAFPWNVPIIQSSVPADGATGVAVNANIVLTFECLITAVTGKNFYIKRTDTDATVETIAADDVAVTIADDGITVTINPSDFGSGLGLYLTNDLGALVGPDAQDMAVMPKTDLNWTVASGDAIDPVFLSGSPADNAADVAIDSNFILNVTEANTLSLGTSKNLYLYNITDATITETIASSSTGTGAGQVNLVGNALTANPTVNLVNSKAYCWKWDVGFFKDGSGNEIAANTSETLYNFTAAAAAGTNMVAFTGSQVKTAESANTIADGYKVFVKFNIEKKSDATTENIYRVNTFGRVYCKYTTSGRLDIVFKTTGGASVWNTYTSNDALLVSHGEVEILIIVDSSTGGDGILRVYRDQTEIFTKAASNATELAVEEDWWIGGSDAATGDMTADIGNFQIGTHTQSLADALTGGEIDALTATWTQDGDAAAWNGDNDPSTGDNMEGTVTDV